MEEKVCTSHCFPFPVFVADQISILYKKTTQPSLSKWPTTSPTQSNPSNFPPSPSSTDSTAGASTSRSAKPLHWKRQGNASSTGAYTHASTHLSHLPLSTLHSEKATKQVLGGWDQRWMEGASRVWSSTRRKCIANRLSRRNVGGAHYLATPPAI